MIHPRWTSREYYEHRRQLHIDAKAGLDLGVRVLSPSEIRREYPAKKITALLNEVKQKHLLWR